MSPRSLSAALTAVALLLPATTWSQDPEKSPPPAETETKKIKGWGDAADPAGNCEIESKKDGAELEIKLPAGAEKARNMCVEFKNMDAPRVQRKISGDFELQVKVDGAFEPGEEVLEGSRVPYLGAGLNIMADDSNYICMERAVMRYPTDEPNHLINFEIRVDGKLERYGSNEKWPLDPDKPVWLRLERSGDSVRGAVSHDGKEWTWGEPKNLTADAWKEQSVKAGIHAISTCSTEFAPKFSDFLLEEVEKEGQGKDGKKDPDKKSEKPDEI